MAEIDRHRANAVEAANGRVLIIGPCDVPGDVRIDVLLVNGGRQILSVSLDPTQADALVAAIEAVRDVVP